MNNFKLVLKKIDVFIKEDSKSEPKNVNIEETIISEDNLKKFKSRVEDYLYNKKLKIEILDSNCNFYCNTGFSECHFEIFSSNRELYEDIFDWLDSDVF